MKLNKDNRSQGRPGGDEVRWRVIAGARERRSRMRDKQKHGGGHAANDIVSNYICATT